MIYLDTSCLLKLLREEPESADVRSAVDAEDQVAVSSCLAAMEELKLNRLLTLDKAQGAAAEALDYEVIYPGRG